MHPHLALPLALLLACAGGTTAADPPVPDPDAPPSATDAPSRVGADDVASCAACHAAVVDEWRQSMHARAHHAEDPVYAAMRTLRLGKEGPALAGSCDTCHAPRTGISPDASAGVTCATCHTTIEVKPSAMGAAALVADPAGDLRGPHDLPADRSPAHPTGPRSAPLADGTTLCLACHDAVANTAGVASCTTGPEHRATPDAATCASCHMPRAAGPSGAASTRPDHAAHTFAGPHRAWYQADPSLLASALRVEPSWTDAGLAIAVTNVTGHAFPTGFPGRVAALRVVGRDSAGIEVWASFTDDPATQAPEALWNKLYVDDAGQPALAPYAAALKADRRLPPGGRVQLAYAPPAAVARVEVELVFRLMAPPLAATLGLADAPEATPRKVVLATLDR